MAPSVITALLFLIKTTMSQSVTECDESFECSNQTVYDQNIMASGYKSASGPKTMLRANDSYCLCHGAFSCYDVLNVSLPSTIKCRGVHSCTNSNAPSRYITNHKLTASDQIWCSGANSCTNSNIDLKGASTDSFLTCHGFRSCMNSYISSVPIIWASAAYALENATIDSEGIPGDTLTIYVYGYNAAIYAHFVCRSSHHCHIHCAQCDLLQCSGDCTFYRSDNYNFSEVLTANIDALYNNLKNITLENDEECSNEDISTTFDGIDTPFTNTLIRNKSNVCCRAKGSCSGKTFRNTTATQKFIFSARSSFSNSHLNVSGAIFCTGSTSCIDSIVNASSDNLYCFGVSSCKRLIIHQLHGNVICFAAFSCKESTIFTAGNGETHYVYFLGPQSGEAATLHCKQEDECIVICGGLWACRQTTVMCRGVCDIQCTSYSECPVVHTFNPSSYPSLNPTDSPSEALSGSTLQPSFYPSFNPTTVTLYPTWNETETTAYSSLTPLKTTSFPSSNPLNQTPTIDTAPISTLNSTMNSKRNTVPTDDRVTTEYDFNNEMDDDQQMNPHDLLTAVLSSVVLMLCICVVIGSICFYRKHEGVVHKHAVKFLGMFEKRDASAKEHEISDIKPKKDAVKREQDEAEEKEDDVQLELEHVGVTPGVMVHNVANILSGSIKMTCGQQTEGRQKELSNNVDEQYDRCNECGAEVERDIIAMEGPDICSSCKEVDEMVDENHNHETAGTTEH